MAFEQCGEERSPTTRKSRSEASVAGMFQSALVATLCVKSGRGCSAKIEAAVNAAAGTRSTWHRVHTAGRGDREISLAHRAQQEEYRHRRNEFVERHLHRWQRP